MSIYRTLCGHVLKGRHTAKSKERVQTTNRPWHQNLENSRTPFFFMSFRGLGPILKTDVCNGIILSCFMDDMTT